MSTSASSGSSTFFSLSSPQSTAHPTDDNSSASENDGIIASDDDDGNMDEFEFAYSPVQEAKSDSQMKQSKRRSIIFTLHKGPMPLASLEPALAELEQREFNGNAMNKLRSIPCDATL